jgi:hypothetical protein
VVQAGLARYSTQPKATDAAGTQVIAQPAVFFDAGLLKKTWRDFVADGALVTRCQTRSEHWNSS